MKRVSLILAVALIAAPVHMRATNERQLAGAVLCAGYFGLAVFSGYLNYKVNFCNTTPGGEKLHEKVIGIGMTAGFAGLGIKTLYDTLTKAYLQK